MFGEYIRERRLKLGLSLRRFCLDADIDPSNWSKVERKLLPPPTDKDTLLKVAEVIGIEPDTSEWNKLEDYANIDAGQIPKYIVSDDRLVQFLPAFFRSIGGNRPMSEEIQELLEQLRKEYS